MSVGRDVDASPDEARQHRHTQEPSAMSTKSTSTTTTTKPDAIELVEKVAAATKLDGVSVETRQKNDRPVIVITDEHGKRLLAYVSPITQGARAGGFAIEIADWGSYRRESVATVAAAAKAVKSSKRVKPKAKPEPKTTPKTTPKPKSDDAADGQSYDAVDAKNAS